MGIGQVPSTFRMLFCPTVFYNTVILCPPLQYTKVRWLILTNCIPTLRQGKVADSVQLYSAHLNITVRYIIEIVKHINNTNNLCIVYVPIILISIPNNYEKHIVLTHLLWSPDLTAGTVSGIKFWNTIYKLT